MRKRRCIILERKAFRSYTVLNKEKPAGISSNMRAYSAQNIEK